MIFVFSFKNRELYSNKRFYNAKGKKRLQSQKKKEENTESRKGLQRGSQ
jgi:hypothetical protein